MFTGIIEKKGKISDKRSVGKMIKLKIDIKDFTNDLINGSSVAVDGVCLTVINLHDDYFEVDVINETIGKTNISSYVIGTEVNLEKALKISDRLNGHIVQGHVDCTAELVREEKIGEDVELTFRIPEYHINEIVKKGSVTIDGISLTVADKKGNDIIVALIPATLEITNIGIKRVGDLFNIETDILAKYIKNLVSEQVKNINTITIN